MQRPSGQYDHLARLPRTGPRQGRGRRSFAPRHWCRAAPRRSRGMAPTVRNPRIESTIGFRSCSNSLPGTPNSRAPAVQFRPEIRSPGTEFLDAETGGQKSTRETVIVGRDRQRSNTRQESPQNGLFSIDAGFRDSGRLDGGVRSQLRTGLVAELPDNWLFTGYF